MNDSDRARLDARTTTTETTNRPRRHRGLRTLDAHATATEVYAAMHAPYTGTNPDWVPERASEQASDVAALTATFRATTEASEVFRG